MAINTDAQIKHIYDQWHERNAGRDLEGLTALYADDATFESPAVFALLGTGKGIIRGRVEIHAFFETFFGRLDDKVADWYRTGLFFSDGRLLTWEYPRETPNGDQVDLVESMDIENGLIVRHRVYWGWVGLQTLLNAMKGRSS